MSQAIIDYTFDTTTPKNADGTLAASGTGGQVVAGPGASALGNYSQAMQFDASTVLSVALPAAQLNRAKFVLRVLFKIDAKPATAQVLAASNILPLRLQLEPSQVATSDFQLSASVSVSQGAAGAATTKWIIDLKLGTWYLADLVYDTDTLGLFIDGIMRAVRAFPDGTIANAAGDQLQAGAAVGGAQKFIGDIAALQLHADIPIALESQLDEWRAHPQWYLTYKEEELRPHIALGSQSEVYQFDLPSGAWVQQFDGATLMYHESVGCAFEMHGAIRAAYWAMANRGVIGHLISDEINTAGGHGRKSLFDRGGLYAAPRSGVYPVLGQMWVDYESLGESAAIGLPVGNPEPVPAGTRQRFQQAHMYWREGEARAFEVHGAILAKYLASGEVGAWGFPTTNEGDLRNGPQAIGRVSEFERCTIYWSAPTGAFEVHGDIRVTYNKLGGPGGSLGFPTSDEADVPGAPGSGRYNTFERGTIVWFGSIGETYVCQAFDVNIGRIDSKESEGWGRGQNDVYARLTLEDNGHVIHTERIPGNGDSNGHNVYNINRPLALGPQGIVPNRADCVIKFYLDMWDSDWPDDDDHLGYYEHVLDLANAWGLRGNRSGLFNSGGFANINSLTWSVSPRVNEALLDDNQRWWGVRNKGTPELTWPQYSAAFSDVDSDTEWWDPSDWLAALFYEAVAKGLAKSGNCFGMSLEAINSAKHRSILRLPLDRFTDWSAVQNEFNIKHQYQVGAPAIWWFAGQFLSGRTHDPVEVFHSTRDARARGMDPVLCIAQNYDFSGKPHCILPVAWDDSSKPWRLWVHDPNFPSPQSPALRAVLVDPDANTFHYDGSSAYDGGEWSGGRMHYMPYSVLCEQPRTPVFEALMLLLSGAMIIVGTDGETVSLTDEDGTDLDAFGADAVARLKAGQSLTGKFVPFKGFDAHTDHCAVERTGDNPGDRPTKPQHDRPSRPFGVLPSELYLRASPRPLSRYTPPDRRGGTDWTRLTLREYLCQWAPARIRRAMEEQREFVAANEGRLMHHVMRRPNGGVSDRAIARPDFFERIAAGTGLIRQPSALGAGIVHQLRGVRRGQFQYAIKQGLTEVLVSGESLTGDQHELRIRDLGTHTSSFGMVSSRDNLLSIRVHTRLGVGRDHLRMQIDGLRVAAGQSLKLNVKPGLGGVEVVSGGAISARATMQLHRRGARFEGVFKISEERGVRLLPSTMLTNKQLKVAQIDELLGESLRTRLVNPV